MDKIRKTIRRQYDFNESERRAIIEEYLNGTESRIAVWRKHTGYKQEDGNMIRWMKKLGYIDNRKTKYLIKPSFILENDPEVHNPDEMQKRIKELERKLQDAQIKADGYLLMIEVAEKELKIPIRKKSDTK